MRKGARFWVVALGALLFVAGASRVSGSTSTYYGCFTCKYVGLTGIGEVCHGVAPFAGGDGWICHEDNTLPWPDGPFCWVEGGLCTNGGDGGGGSGSGDGGSTCQSGGFCPAECFSCGGSGGGPYAN
jgi:hypothetical protein